MKTKTGFILLGLMVLFFITCRKEKDDPAGGNKIELGVNLIDTVSYFFTGIQTEVISLGGTEIIQHGHCWNTEPKPTIEESCTCLGNLTSSNDFMSEIDSLKSNTVYYIRPYIQTVYAVAYGEEEQIKTLKTGKPVVSTNPVTDITPTSAFCGGIITHDSGLFVTARGVCWDTTDIVLLEDCNGFTIDSLGLGEYISEISNLQEGTDYKVTAYATNEEGTSYGEVKVFTTIPITLAEVITSEISNVTTNSAQCGGNVIDEGNGTVTVKGVCWNTSGDPTLQNCIDSTSNGGGMGSFTSNITGLTPNTNYYVRAYAINEEGIGYGNQVVFTTLTVPTVITTAVSDISYTTATSGGNVTNDGGAPVTTRGVCWSTSQNPTISDSHTTNGLGNGSFISNITGLTQNTTYYIRAYATNSVGTAYGNQVSFNTLQITLPSVTTTPVTNITSTIATSGGNVTDDGGTTVTERGVCWSTLGNPTISDPHTNDGSGTGSFTSNIIGLTPNTTYYVRAYATNSEGTAYGNQVNFITQFENLCFGTPTVYYEGQTYNTVQIGNQCWFRENLNVGTMISGVLEQTNNGIKEKYCFDNSPINCTTYGGLYQWDEMMQYTTVSGTIGLCPTGWHIPTHAELIVITNFLGGETVAGGKMKEEGTLHWDPPNTGATNESGFTALPGGERRENPYFLGLSQQGVFWSSTEGAQNWWAYIGYLYHDNASMLNNLGDYKIWGLSVRCLRDE